MASSENKDPVITRLLLLSNDMKLKAYCPYSGYRVGAALLCEDGTIYTGCNVENASYGLSICAERTAIVKAVSDGHKDFKAIAISCDDEKNFVSPCGACRQFMVEFGIHYQVYLTRPDLTYKRVVVRDLLPDSFGPHSLAN